MNKVPAFPALCFFACCALAAAPGANRPQTSAGREALTLQEAIRLALARAPEVSLAETQVLRAGEALRETKASNRPQVVAGTGLAYNNGFPLSIEGSAPSAFQVGLSQPLFSKKNRNLIRAAEEGVRAGKIGSESARNDLAARAALLYGELHQARKLAAVWALRVDLVKKDQQVAESLLEAGKLRQIDILQAQTSSAGAQQQLLVAQEQARLAEVELRELTGFPQGEPLNTVEARLDPQILATPGESLYLKALETHPDVRQAESNLRAKEFRIEAEKGGRYPKIDFVSQYSLFTRFNNYQDYFNRFSRNNYLVGLSVQVPLFDAFLTSSRVAQVRQEAAEERFRLERLKSELKLSIERTLSALRIARGAGDLARREQETALEAVRVQQTLFEGGRIGVREMNAARSLVKDKEIAVLEADRIAFQRYVELLRLTGNLSTLS